MGKRVSSDTLLFLLETKKAALGNLHRHRSAEGNATTHVAEPSPPSRLKPVGLLSFHITGSSLALLPQDLERVRTWLEELPVILAVNQWPTLLLHWKHRLGERLFASSEDLINNWHEGHAREQACGRGNGFYEMSLHDTSPWQPSLF